MLPAFRTTALTAITALSLALTTAAPAQALGKNERNLLKGIAAVAIIGAILNDANKKANARPQYHEPRYADPQPRYADPQPRYTDPQPRYRNDHAGPPRQQGRIIGSGHARPQVQGTPAARVFTTYSPAERRAIQRSLARYGYYRGGIDGAFGPSTYNALAAYARDVNQGQALSTNGGVYGLYDSLIQRG